MSVAHVEILVEEPSAEAVLRILAAKILRRTSFEVYPFRSKQDLLAKLPARLKGYARWLPRDCRIVVLADCDSDNCKHLKQKLETAARQAGLVTRTAGRGKSYQVVNRLAIEELEAWFFGDWDAVRKAFPNVSRDIPNKRGYRDPDAIAGGTWEALERVLQRAGYFKTGLRKVEAAQAIAQHMDPARNRSRSFRVFWEALSEMAQ